MHAAFSIWENRIAPVLDAASTFVVVSLSGGDRARVELERPTPGAILEVLLERHVSVLVCGAVSRALRDAVAARGITVHPFVSGELAEVVRAWRDGGLDAEHFRMPGCGRDSARPGGPGRQRLRRRGVGRERAGIPYGAYFSPGEGVVCRCPRCGYETVRTPDTPCSRSRCPHCQTWLVRA